MHDPAPGGPRRACARRDRRRAGDAERLRPEIGNAQGRVYTTTPGAELVQPFGRGERGSLRTTTIPGETVSSAYASSSTGTLQPNRAWFLHLFTGRVAAGERYLPGYVRAVRGGS